MVLPTEMGGGGSESVNNINNKNANDFIMKDLENKTRGTKNVRVRQYGDKNRGPFIVCVRANNNNNPLRAITLMKFLQATFTSKIITDQINEFKVNVTFMPKKDDDESISLARKEANDFPKTEWAKHCRVFIPERLSETVGCIVYSIHENVEDLIADGEGIFNNVLMPRVTVLDATRFEKVFEEDGKELRREPTRTVRVVFEGLVMPNHLFIHGLRIRVREFKRKQMFCESCYKYNHTKEFCNNKPYKVNAEDKKCIHCKTDDHKTGDRKCSKRKSLEKGVEKALKASRRKTYAEMLHDLDPSAKNNNDVMDKHFPVLNLGTRKSRMQFQDKKVTLSNDKHDNIHAKKRRLHEIFCGDGEESDFGEPPGFKNKIDEDENEDETNIFIKSFVDDLDLPPFLTQLIMRFAVPIINKLIQKFTTSLMEKMANYGSK